MSIQLISNAGLTLLQTAQQKSQINSANMANARTEGYSVKSVSQRTEISAGRAVGVDTSKLKGSIDRQLQRRLTAMFSESEFKTTIAKNLKSLSALFGNLGDKNSTLSAKVSQFMAKLVALKSQPNSHENALHAVRALENITNQLRSISKDLQTQRTNASHAIQSNVQRTNQLLEEIHTLNKEISTLNAGGSSVANLEDQRRQALKELSGLINVSSFINSDNKAVVTTQKGTLLVGAHLKKLDYTSPATLSKTAIYPGGIPGISVDGKDITTEISSGKIAAHIQLRDTDLPNKQKELDEFSSQLKHNLNKVASQGISYPLSNTISGSEKLNTSTPLPLSGNMQIALTDASGKVANVQTLSLSGVGSIGVLVGQLNALPGVNAALNSEGKLEISSTDPNQRIAVLPNTSQTSGTPPKNISQILGINTLVSGKDSSDITVNDHLRSNPMLFPRATGNLTVGKALAVSGDSTNVTALITQLKSASFKSAGNMAASTQSFADYASNMLSILAEKTATAQSQSKVAQNVVKGISKDIASKSGVNMDEEIAKLAANQKAFQVAGHIIKTSQTMFDTLLNMARR